MTKKMITGLKVLTIACSALLLVAACAKKQIQAPSPYPLAGSSLCKKTDPGSFPIRVTI